MALVTVAPSPSVTIPPSASTKPPVIAVEFSSSTVLPLWASMVPPLLLRLPPVSISVPPLLASIVPVFALEYNPESVRGVLSLASITPPLISSKIGEYPAGAFNPMLPAPWIVLFVFTRIAGPYHQPPPIELFALFESVIVPPPDNTVCWPVPIHSDAPALVPDNESVPLL